MSVSGNITNDVVGERVPLGPEHAARARGRHRGASRARQGPHRDRGGACGGDDGRLRACDRRRSACHGPARAVGRRGDRGRRGRHGPPGRRASEGRVRESSRSAASTGSRGRIFSPTGRERPASWSWRGASGSGWTASSSFAAATGTTSWTTRRARSSSPSEGPCPRTTRSPWTTSTRSVTTGATSTAAEASFRSSAARRRSARASCGRWTIAAPRRAWR